MKRITNFFLSIFFSLTSLSAKTTTATKNTSVETQTDITTLIFYIIIIPTIILIVISWILVKKNKCVIFYGRNDQLNSFLTFPVPVIAYFLVTLILNFFKINETFKFYIPIITGSSIFFYGMYYLIRNAILFNTNQKIYIPFVIFMKIYIGFIVGFAFAISAISWGTNLRNISQSNRDWIWLIRWISSLIGIIFMFITHILTTYPEEEMNSESFILPFGRTHSKL
ncbi:hypothetical protein [Leptospira bandrabouensis]|uniref:Uncharacterized protein n=1 Tax=Leptospira bandrabouensis TaxID=2484903 RepID=A0A6H3NQ13_9LEPT|nr:hypothetical protein [Leptospira bandrabouensis]TGN03902.1 hypothetical protein EHR07_18965 [Leptospira bandrabouensis]TGN12072.1 hypothetical protein EHR08_11810 [Leptospira bandrabouensis]